MSTASALKATASSKKDSNVISPLLKSGPKEKAHSPTRSRGILVCEASLIGVARIEACSSPPLTESATMAEFLRKHRRSNVFATAILLGSCQARRISLARNAFDA
jgi:hypothetical protein